LQDAVAVLVLFRCLVDNGQPCAIDAEELQSAISR